MRKVSAVKNELQEKEQQILMEICLSPGRHRKIENLLLFSLQLILKREGSELPQARLSLVQILEVPQLIG